MADNLNEQVGVATPVETTDHAVFSFKNKDEEGKPIKEETLASEFDQKIQVSDPVEVENKHDGIVAIPRSYSSSSSDEEGDDEEKKQKKKEKKGLKDKLMDKLPGHKDEVVEEPHVPIEEPHVQEVVYSDFSEPPHTEEDPEKKGLLDKIKEKLPGQDKTDDHHADEAVPVVIEPAVEGDKDYKGLLDKMKEKIPGQNKTDDHHDVAVPVVAEPIVEGEEDKKGFMDKIKDKIPGLSSSKTSDEKNDHVDK
ncbi:uncharacterized protein LOC141611534 [Silene latifolia]|uniref:uncharacterized protein LOC141611534 n=1 Tax=Silene latifolia TaxID=37657 RepID=UPI003D785BF3